MPGFLFKEKWAHIVGETFERERRGTGARERLRARLSLLTEDSTEIADAARLGTTFIGLEGWTPEQLLQAARRRFQAARGQGDDLPIHS
jgi:hypothetical protein